METLFFGVLTFMLVLGPLVILHELGHFVTAKIFGVKVLEFGFGFPPRMSGIWTGRTTIYLGQRTRYVTGEAGAEEFSLAPADGTLPSRHSDELRDVQSRPKKGDIITIRAVESESGRMEATIVRPKMAIDEDEQVGGHVYVGKIREIHDDHIVIADMVWSINWLLPLGGFVRLLGEEDPTAEGSLASKGRGVRIIVMAAGAAVNAIIPFVLLPIVLMIPQNVPVGDVTITSVFPGSPSAEAGLRRGDKIVRVDGRDIESIADLQSAITLKLGAESTWEIMPGIIDPFAGAGEPQYQYTGEIETVTLTPRWKPPQKTVVGEVTDPDTQLMLGEARIYYPEAGISDSLTVVSIASDTLHEISLADARQFYADAEIGDVLDVVLDGADSISKSDISLSDARQLDSALGTRTRLQEGAVGAQISTVNIHDERRSEGFFSAFPKGAQQAWDSIVLTRNAITGYAVGSQNPQFTESDPLTGPVGIGQLTGEIAVADASLSAKITTLASLAAVISFSLAIMNILPIPALDGGRILFVVIEILRGGKRISPKREGLVHLAGFVVLLLLIAVISVKDITRIFNGESFF